MATVAEQQLANVTPPRRGAVLALAVDTTARAYDLKDLVLGGYAPKEDLSRAEYVYVTLQAVGDEGDDVWFVFSTTSAADLDESTEIAAGNALVFADTFGWRLAAGTSVRVRISRSEDRFLITKAAANTPTLLLRASSDSCVG